MYDFTHSINKKQRYNIDQSYHDDIEDESNRPLHNPFIFTLIMIIIFIAGIFTYKFYQEHYLYKEKHIVKNQIEKLTSKSSQQLTQAITKSIAKNLQSKNFKQQLDDAKLRRIIKRVVRKIESKPIQTVYSNS